MTNIKSVWSSLAGSSSSRSSAQMERSSPRCSSWRNNYSFAITHSEELATCNWWWKTDCPPVPGVRACDFLQTIYTYKIWDKFGFVCNFFCQHDQKGLQSAHMLFIEQKSFHFAFGGTPPPTVGQFWPLGCRTFYATPIKPIFRLRRT